MRLQPVEPSLAAVLKDIGNPNVIRKNREACAALATKVDTFQRELDEKFAGIRPDSMAGEVVTALREVSGRLRARLG